MHRVVLGLGLHYRTDGDITGQEAELLRGAERAEALARTLEGREAALGAARRELAAARRAGAAGAARTAGLAAALGQLLAAPDAGRCLASQLLASIAAHPSISHCLKQVSRRLLLRATSLQPARSDAHACMHACLQRKIPRRKPCDRAGRPCGTRSSCCMRGCARPAAAAAAQRWMLLRRRRCAAATPRPCAP